MDTIIEILVDCVLSLIVDSGMEIMTDSDSRHKWPKGVRIALVATTLIILLAVLGLLIIAGISLISESKIVVGVLLLALASAFVIFPVIKFRKIYKKKSAGKK